MFFLRPLLETKLLSNSTTRSKEKAMQLPAQIDHHTGNVARSSIWGPTCDGLDVVVEDTVLPVLNIGDWILFENMGAYTFAAASSFNGFPIPIIFNVINEPTV